MLLLMYESQQSPASWPGAEHRVLLHMPTEYRENVLPQQLGPRAVKVGFCHFGSPALCRKVPHRGLSMWFEGSLGFRLLVQHWAGCGLAAAVCEASLVWCCLVRALPPLSPGIKVRGARFPKTRPILMLLLCLQPAPHFHWGRREAREPCSPACGCTAPRHAAVPWGEPGPLSPCSYQRRCLGALSPAADPARALRAPSPSCEQQQPLPSFPFLHAPSCPGAGPQRSGRPPAGPARPQPRGPSLP